MHALGRETMKNRIKKRRLYSFRAVSQLTTSIKRLKGNLLNGVLARFDPHIHGGEVWGEMTPVGEEFGALADAATTAANRTTSAIDETPRFVDESNRRIYDMEKPPQHRRTL